MRKVLKLEVEDEGLRLNQYSDNGNEKEGVRSSRPGLTEAGGNQEQREEILSRREERSLRSYL